MQKYHGRGTTSYSKENRIEARDAAKCDQMPAHAKGAGPVTSSSFEKKGDLGLGHLGGLGGRGGGGGGVNTTGLARMQYGLVWEYATYPIVW